MLVDHSLELLLHCTKKEVFRKGFLNPFFPNAPFLCPLKTSENLTVFLWFQGAEKGRIGNKWVK